MNTGNAFHIFKITIVILLFWLTGIAPILSQDYIFDVDVIGVEDGLPQRNVHYMVQDAAGFIWLSTPGNIHRYDGYNFKTYPHSFLNIPENNSPYLAVDHANRLWYLEKVSGTEIKGTGVIDTQKDTIYAMEAISGGLFTHRDVLFIKNSRVYPNEVIIATRSGIVYRYNGNFEVIYRFNHELINDIVFEDAPDGSYWFFYGYRLIQVKDKKRLKTIVVSDEKLVSSIITSPQGIIVETISGLRSDYWKQENDTLMRFSIQGETPEEVKQILQVNEHYICYATKDKLLVRDHQGNMIYTFDDFESLKFNIGITMQAILIDQQNTLWIATAYGILKMTSESRHFKILKPQKSMRAIFQEGKKLWMGAYKGNLISDTETGIQSKFSPYTAVAMTGFYKDDKGHIWIGTDQSYLMEYIPHTDTYMHYSLNINLPFYVPFQNVLTKRYWAGTEHGLFRLHKKKDTLNAELYPLPVASKSLYIRQFYQNTEGVWIISSKGIFLMDAEKETIIKHYTIDNGLPSDNINHIYEDKQGIFWLGTKGSGLLRWDRSANTFLQYTRKNGLSNNTIYAVYEDDFETLWLPSDYGLMAFDKNTETTRVYLPQNGIAHEEFNTFSHFQAKDGTLYFGGLNGVTKFHPKDLQKEYDTAPPLHVNKVNVLQKDAEDFTDKTTSYFDQKKVRLHSSDRILELEISLLDYRKSAKNQYAYKLTGKQEQWVYTGEPKISIINPPYGRYELVIKARGASGSWSQNILTIPVYKPLPFYRQWWFIVIVIMIIIFVFSLINKWRLRKLRRDRKQLEEEVRKRTCKIEQDKQTIEAQAEDLKVLDKAKTRFFTNITHELRTPLTLILGPAEQLLTSKIPEPLKAPAKTIRNNAGHLLDLINQLLDVSRLESGQMQIKASTADVVAFSGKLAEGFRPLADEKKQKLVFTPALSGWKTHFDPEKLNKIIYNLLSNAIKYTPGHGHIELSVFKKEDNNNVYIGIRVKDTGIGIDPDVLPHIFDRFYQADDSATRKGEGTGIGLALVKELVELLGGDVTVESILRKGTVFTVMLPVLQAPLHSDFAIETLQFEPPVVTYPKIISDEKPDGISQKNKLKLLIIEDHTEMRRYIRSCIDDGLYRITEAADGLAGIKKAKEIVPDLIISDVMMPKKDGFELTQAIRSHIATSHIPLILLTAKASEENRLEGISRGADVYLTKPFSPLELKLRIEKLIEIRQLIQRRYQGPEAFEESAAFKKEDHFVVELKDYIIRHISDPGLSGGEVISKHFAMSRMQLYRKLRALLNSDISSYVRNIRLEMAMRLLKEKQLNVAEVAYETGFSSPKHFSRTFKKAYGKSPSQIRLQ